MDEQAYLQSEPSGKLNFVTFGEGSKWHKREAIKENVAKLVNNFPMFNKMQQELAFLRTARLKE